MAKISSILWRVGSYIVALLMLVTVVAPQGALAAPSDPQNPSSAELARSNRIHWLNGNYFLSGTNLPFFRAYGGDIAAVTTRNSDNGQLNSGSVLDQANALADLESDFAKMQAAGINTLRWFLFGDGRGAPEFDGTGKITKLEDSFYTHMDQVLAMARRHNIYIIWSLFDFTAFENARWTCNVPFANIVADAEANSADLPDGMRQQFVEHVKMAARTTPFGTTDETSGKESAQATEEYCLLYGGGHSNMVTNNTVQDSLFNNALIPLLRRYGSNPNIIGWEIMNEPEWVVSDSARMGRNPLVHQPVALAPLQAFFRRFTAAVHANTNQLATVGSAGLRWMGTDTSDPVRTPNVWGGLGFDYYNVHYYGWMDDSPNGSPLDWNYNSLPNLDAPVVIGEYPANGGSPAVYLPLVRHAGAEYSVLNLRSVCSTYTTANDVLCTHSITAQIEYRTTAGVLVNTQTVNLAPGGSASLNAPPWTGDWSGSARISANGPIAAQITQGNIPNAAETVAYIGQDRGANNLYLPLVLNTTNRHRTRIAIQNTAVSPAHITIKYYRTDGSLASTDGAIILNPRGSLLIDPTGSEAAQSKDSADAVNGIPANFQGSAEVTSDQPLAGVVYELDPTAGSDAYNAVPLGYVDTTNLPSIRNDGVSTLYLQNTGDGGKSVTVSYYNAAGTALGAQAGDTFTIPGRSVKAIDLAARLPGGFVGSARVRGGPFIASVVRNAAAAGGNRNLQLYAGSPDTADRFAFPVALSGDSNTIITAQNINFTKPINVVVAFNSVGGQSTVVNATLAPRSSKQFRASDYVGNNFLGSAAVLWPWVDSARDPDGAFPLLASARTVNNAGSSGQGYLGALVHSRSGIVTDFLPRQMMDGILANNWAGALSWSYYAYEAGTGDWNDVADATLAFNQAHPDIVNIGGCQFSFSDVDASQYFYAPLRELYCDGVISGYADNTFRPFANATRGQVAKIITLSHGWTIDTTGGPHFSDVPTSNAFYTFIETAFKKGVISGYADGTFKWGNNITRGQLSKVVVKAAGWDLVNPQSPSFRDVQNSNPFYKEIETAVRHNVISGYDVSPGIREFRWNLNATRGQIGKIVFQSLSSR